jgi:hypothetical protein
VNIYSCCTIRAGANVLSRKAEDLVQISAAAHCEELIGKHSGMFVDRTALHWDLDPRKMTPQQFDVIQDAMIKKASGGDPAQEAEISRTINLLKHGL